MSNHQASPIASATPVSPPSSDDTLADAVSAVGRDIRAFGALEVLAKAQALEAQGHSIVHLEIGEPDFPTPEPVVETALRALRDGDTHYTTSAGIIELREAISAYYESQYGVSVHPDRIVVTCGTSPAMVLAFSSLLNPGDEALLIAPHYPPYPNFLRQVGAKARTIEASAANGYSVPVEAMREAIDDNVRAVVINSPCNPTGAILQEDDLRAIADMGPYIISDEIYHGIVYEGRARSILEFTDRAFVIDGFSKRYAMTGWRLGYIIAPPGFERAVLKLQQNLFVCAPSFTQRAGITALKEGEPYVEQMVKTYDERRRFLLEGLRSVGLEIPSTPTGAFYILADARAYDDNSNRLALDILEGAGVAVTPGGDFGAEGHLRFSYASSMDNLEEAVERLRVYFERRREEKKA